MNDLERKEALERELARREAKKSTSARQAAYLTGRGRAGEPAEPAAVAQREPAWGDDGERHERGSSNSRRQAARATRGASRRGDS